MNKMKEVAKLLGVELGEEFIIEGCCNNPYKFEVNGLFDCSSIGCPIHLLCLLQGDYEIVKIPFKPKKGDVYWIYSTLLKRVDNYLWDGASSDYAYYKIGNCFRTKEEAETKGKELMEAIVKEYENE